MENMDIMTNDVMEEATDIVTENSKMSFGKLALIGLAATAVVAGVCIVVKKVKAAKNNQVDMVEAEFEEVDTDVVSTEA